MKKIVYILAATMLSSSAAFAVAPRVKAVTSASVEKAEKTTISRSSKLNNLSAPMMRAQQIQSLRNNKINSVLSDETATDETPSVKAMYAPTSGSFYLGLTPGLGMWGAQFGFTGIKNLIGFPNMSTNADAYEWTYGYAVDYDANTGLVYYDDQTSNDQNLFMPLQPLQEYQAPILNASGAYGEDTYQADIESYMTGRDPLSWGFNRSLVDMETGTIAFADRPGFTIYSHQITGLTGVPYFAYNTTDKKNYDANGTSTAWSRYFAGSEEVKYSNWKFTAFACYLPAKPSSYLLDNIYGDFYLSTSEDITLTCNVYFLPTNDEEEMGAPVATGQLSIPAGDFPSEDSEELPSFRLVAIDEDGYETDEALVVPALQSLYITFEGFTHPAVTQFVMGVLEGLEIPAKEFNWKYVNTLSPTHAYAQMDVDVMTPDLEEPVTINIDAPCPSAFYVDETMSNVFFPSDFSLFFHAYFPVIANLDPDSEDYGTADFEVTIPADGGASNVIVGSDFSITVLLEEGLMKSVATDEWIKYNVEEIENENGLFTQVTIEADALPEGVNGRQGAVVFDGYACDFYIIVNQGDVAGISNVAAAANGPVEFFDLQGRKLNAAPANGIYLQRQGNKTIKKIAK